MTCVKDAARDVAFHGVASSDGGGLSWTRFGLDKASRRDTARPGPVMAARRSPSPWLSPGLTKRATASGVERVAVGQLAEHHVDARRP